jgi:hypothetical protein
MADQESDPGGDDLPDPVQLDVGFIAADQQLREEEHEFAGTDQDPSFEVPPDLRGRWHHPLHWPHGDNMSKKGGGVTRIGTLNVGKSGPGSYAKAEAVAMNLVELMRVYRIDVLCLQEVHRSDDQRDAVTAAIERILERNNYHLHYQGEAEETHEQAGFHRGCDNYGPIGAN